MQVVVVVAAMEEKMAKALLEEMETTQTNAIGLLGANLFKDFKEEEVREAAEAFIQEIAIGALGVEFSRFNSAHLLQFPWILMVHLPLSQTLSHFGMILMF